MALYRLYRNFGWVGTKEFMEEEFETEEEATAAANEYAMERVEYWAVLVEDDPQ